MQAQLRVVKEEGREGEERLSRQLKEAQADRNACLEAACRADQLIARYGTDAKGTISGSSRSASPNGKIQALDAIEAKLAACLEEGSRMNRSTAALDGIAAAGTTLLKMKGQEARRTAGSAVHGSPVSPASGRFAQLFQDTRGIKHDKSC